MRIALVSDVHLEFGDLFIKNDQNADVLIIAGDLLIVNDLHDHPEPATPYTPEMVRTLGSRQLKAQEYRAFLKRASSEFPHVIVIAGNHEFYHGRWVSNLQTMRQECAKFNNVYFFEDDHRIINDCVFVGATLWTDMDRGNPSTLYAIAGVMNDYTVIRHDGLGFTKLKPYHTAQRHRDSLEYFKKTLAEHPDKKCVVVSHHAPSHLSIHENYANNRIQNFAYYSDLSEFILDHEQIKLWCHGHTHTAFDYKIGNTRVVCHPRGYVGYERDTQEKEPYQPLLIEI